MKDLSCFLLKNSLAFNMKKGFKNLCNGDASTSTLNQQISSEFMETDHQQHHQPTLEEMIMQLDLEEKLAASTRPSHRMSCVNSSDILRSARNALNQYPRFSLDGKDAMYRSSFRPSLHHGKAGRQLPAKVGGERVIWSKPGVVAKLMGLEAMPIPLRLNHKMNSCIVRKQNLIRSSIERRNRGSCSLASTRYKPVAVKITAPTDEVGWPMGRFM